MLLLDDTTIYIYPKTDYVHNYSEFGHIHTDPIDLYRDGFFNAVLKHYVRTLTIADFMKACAEHNISHACFYVSTDSTSLREYVKSIILRDEISKILNSQLNKLNCDELASLKHNLNNGGCSLAKYAGCLILKPSSEIDTSPYQGTTMNKDVSYAVPWQFGGFDTKKFNSSN